MNILFANGRPPHPFSIGGDGANIDTYFRFLTKKKHHCIWLGAAQNKDSAWTPGIVKRYAYLNKIGRHPSLSFGIDGIHPSITVSYHHIYRSLMTHPYHLAQEMLRLLRTEMPDIVLTQLEQSDVVIKLARAHGIPTILFLTDAEPMAISNLVSLQAEPPTGIVCVSRFVRSAISDATEEAKKIFYPPIAMDDYLEKRRSSASYITCINPVLLKGGAIVEAIIRRLPQEKFLLVEGWYDPLRDGFDFRKYPNVTYLDKQSDMRSVYKRTKLLLVPSVWDEAIPRVIMEAGINGIPSIASRRGGIPEAIGHGGILIDHPYRITDWVNAITVVQSSPKKYQTLSAAASSHSQTFSIDLIGPQFEKWLQMIQKSYRRRF